LLRRSLLPLLILFALPTGLFAQSKSIYSSIVGIVTDPTGAVIEKATVSVVNNATNIESKTISNSDGFFRVERLIAGTYTLKVDMTGFKVFIREQIDLSTAQDIRTDVTLEVGNVTDSVSVVSSIPLIVTESPQISSTLDFEDRKFLPTRDNSFFSTLALESGAVMANPSFYVSFAGSRTDQYDYSIDGQTFRSPLAGHNAENANFSEWQEVVSTSYVNNSAEYSTLTSVNATTKSGGNAIHGGGAYYYTSGWLQGRNPFSPARPTGTDQKYSSAISGPIRKNRTFFFGSYSADRNSSAFSFTDTVPSALERQGNFTEFATPIKDPASGAVFAGNVIPQNRLSPVSLAFVNRFYPLPNFGTGYFAGNFRELTSQSPAEDDVFGRVDHRFSDRHSVFVRYTFDEGNRGGLWTSSITVPAAGMRQGYRRDQNATLSDLFSFTPSLFNEFNMGWTRDHNLITGTTQGPDVIKTIGLQGVNPIPIPGITVMNISGYTTVGQQSDQDIAEDFYDIRDNLSWTHGRHQIKGGFLIAEGRAAQVPFTPDNYFGNFSFANGFATGNAFGDFLLGIPQNESRLNSSEFSRIYLRRLTWQAFLQDDYQVSRRLTLNIGLRWEAFQPFQDMAGRSYSFDPRTGAIVIPNQRSLGLVATGILNNPAYQVETAQQAGLPSRLMATNWLNLAPRIGAAFRLNENTVFRAGFGIFHDFNPPTQAGITPYIPSENFLPNQIVNGVPNYQFPNPFPANPLLISNLGVSFGNPNLKIPYSEQWSFTAERQFRGNSALRVSYIATRGVDELYSRNINVPLPSTTVFTAARRPYPQFSGISEVDNGSGHFYNSLDMRFEQRTRRGIYWHTGYTLAHDTGTNQGSGDNSADSTLNPFNLAAEKGNTFFIPRHRWVTLGDWELPFGKGKPFASNLPKFADALISGWRLSGIATVSSGDWLTPTISGYDSSGTGATAGRPDRIGNGNLSSGQQSASLWFNVAAFTLPGANPATPLMAPKGPIGRFGNSGVGIIEGPGYWQIDTALVKTLPLPSERVHAYLFANATNLLNHPNLADPGMDITAAATAGAITGLRNDGNASGIGVRQLQLGIRVKF
jgi:hypothetical protein